MKKKPSRGGARKGAGRPRKYANPVTATFKVEEDHLIHAKEKHGKGLNSLVNEFLRDC